jgi:hypothetical protein
VVPAKSLKTLEPQREHQKFNSSLGYSSYNKKNLEKIGLSSSMMTNGAKRGKHTKNQRSLSSMDRQSDVSAIRTERVTV